MKQRVGLGKSLRGRRGGWKRCRCLSRTITRASTRVTPGRVKLFPSPHSLVIALPSARGGYPLNPTLEPAAVESSYFERTDARAAGLRFAGTFLRLPSHASNSAAGSGGHSR